MSSTPPSVSSSRTTPATSTSGSSYFEKQRDILIQEISNSIDSVVFNLEVLNRSLNESVQVGKEFEDVGRLWSHFYDSVEKKAPEDE